MPKIMVRPKMNPNAKPFCISLSENVYAALPEDAGDAAKKQAVVDHLALTSPRLVSTDDSVVEDAPRNAAKIKPTAQPLGQAGAATPGASTPGTTATATPGK